MRARGWRRSTARRGSFSRPDPWPAGSRHGAPRVVAVAAPPDRLVACPALRRTKGAGAAGFRQPLLVRHPDSSVDVQVPTESARPVSVGCTRKPVRPAGIRIPQKRNWSPATEPRDRTPAVRSVQSQPQKTLTFGSDRQIVKSLVPRAVPMESTKGRFNDSRRK